VKSLLKNYSSLASILHMWKVKSAIEMLCLNQISYASKDFHTKANH
jgi:hypothetical protein